MRLVELLTTAGNHFWVNADLVTLVEPAEGNREQCSVTLVSGEVLLIAGSVEDVVRELRE